MKKLLSFSLVFLLTLVFAGFVGGQFVIEAAGHEEEVDLISAASITGSEASFKKAMGEEGTWIVCATEDLYFNSELVIEGTFHDKGNSNNEVYRKIGPYAQDDSHNLTERYTISAPQFTVKSPNTKFQGGVFVGDVLVQAEGFTITDAYVVGDVNFASEEYKSSFTTEEGARIFGETSVNADVDVVSSASVTGDEATFAKGLEPDGYWLVAATKDLTFNSELVISGEFENRGEVARELAAYASDEDHNLTERYTITAPQFTVQSPNTIFAGGIFVGDVYVQNKGFTVDDATVIGNVYFENEEYKSSFSVENDGEVTGSTEVK